ncbi:MAG: hypothetical protein C5B45_00735 [Chlamydiae bacterium]|nr:MAG: hypothetical protein C5B45_00735 [Chlamydiota bacterium]
MNSPNFFQTVEERKIRYSVKSFVNACIVCQIDSKTQPEDKIKFIKKIRETLDQKGKEKLNKQLAIHAVPPEGLTISFI